MLTMVISTTLSEKSAALQSRLSLLSTFGAVDSNIDFDHTHLLHSPPSPLPSLLLLLLLLLLGRPFEIQEFSLSQSFFPSVGLSFFLGGYLVIFFEMKSGDFICGVRIQDSAELLYNNQLRLSSLDTATVA